MLTNIDKCFELKIELGTEKIWVLLRLHLYRNSVLLEDGLDTQAVREGPYEKCR